MVKLLLRLCGIERMSRDAILMDHLPIPEPEIVAGTVDTPAKRRGAKLATARERLGKPFKCAARNQDREVFVSPGVVATVGAGLTLARATPPHSESDGFGQHDHGRQIDNGVVAIESRRRR